VPNIISLGAHFKKKFHLVNVAHAYSIKMALFLVSGFTDKKWIKSKPT